MTKTQLRNTLSQLSAEELSALAVTCNAKVGKIRSVTISNLQKAVLAGQLMVKVQTEFRMPDDQRPLGRTVYARKDRSYKGPKILKNDIGAPALEAVPTQAH